jgi:predicted metal-dependent peptidase
MNGQLPKDISRSVLRLRSLAPFLSVLVLHSSWVPRDDIETAATDGQSVFFNPGYIASLSPDQRDFLTAHEVCHLALRHVSRRGTRDPLYWNIAADIVVNGMLIELGLKRIPGAIIDTKLQKMKTEDVYVHVKREADRYKRKLGKTIGKKLRDLMNQGPTSGGKTERELEASWRNVIRRAEVIQRLHASGEGAHPLEGTREIAELLDPRVDWRTLLWCFMVQSPSDYIGWDRRFIHRGQFIESLEGERLTVAVCIDTSGSVDHKMLSEFMSELQGILWAHPHVRILLSFADTKLYGPWPLERGDELPKPVGGGGTSFAPFFRALETGDYGEEEGIDLAVYLTDGMAEVPAEEPETPVLWLVQQGQRQHFPWGEVATMELT